MGEEELTTKEPEAKPEREAKAETETKGEPESEAQTGEAETEESETEEGYSDVILDMAAELYAETGTGTVNGLILEQMVVTNQLLGHIIAILLAIVIWGLMTFFKRLVRDNITKHF